MTTEGYSHPNSLGVTSSMILACIVSSIMTGIPIFLLGILLGTFFKKIKRNKLPPQLASGPTYGNATSGERINPVDPVYEEVKEGNVIELKHNQAYDKI